MRHLCGRQAVGLFPVPLVLNNLNGQHIWTIMRTYEQTHPWISFRWEPRRIPYPVWLLLGGSGALIRTLNQAALPVSIAAATDHDSLMQGLHALAGMEGNTLSERQVIESMEGRLKLTSSQAYLGQEIQNLLKAIRWTEDRLRAGDTQFSPWSLQLLNAQVLKGLPWDEETAPGDYRTAGQHPGAQGGAPAEDITHLIERLCEWLRIERFTPEHAEEIQACGIIRAFLGQLYLLWIRPFTDGNVRTAWLATGQLLLETGLPPIALHRLIAHVGRARVAWSREVNLAGSGHGDPIPFLAFMSRALAESLRVLSAEVEEEQQRAILGGHLRELFGADRSANGARRLQLLMAIEGEGSPVPQAGLARLNPELAITYARLDRKTLLRDVHHLREIGLVEAVGEGLRAKATPMRSFKALVAR